MTKEFVLIGGGARSGKSSFAIELAEGMSQQRIFLATAEASDPEMEERIRRHKQERGAGFSTVEEPRRLTDGLANVPENAVVVIDCVTLWISNLMLDGRSDNDIDREVNLLLEVVHNASFHCVAVTNEVGMGVVPDSALGRRFRDCAGRVNQQLAVCADRVFFAALGCILQIKPTVALAPRNMRRENNHV